jgi:hypothetical protein
MAFGTIHSALTGPAPPPPGATPTLSAALPGATGDVPYTVPAAYLSAHTLYPTSPTRAVARAAGAGVGVAGRTGAAALGAASARGAACGLRPYHRPREIMARPESFHISDVFAGDIHPA